MQSKPYATERKVKAGMLKAGQQVFWLSKSDEYRQAEVYKSQRTSTSKKIQIIDRKSNVSSEPHSVEIGQVFTPEQIKEKAKTEQKPEPSPETFKQGQWLYWTAKPGDVRFVKCAVTPLDPHHLVWVQEIKQGWLDTFTARPKALTSINSPDVVAECEKLER